LLTLTRLTRYNIFIDGPHKDRCLLLRGTMYTLMSDIENAMKDFDRIMELDDLDDNKKVSGHT